MKKSIINGFLALTLVSALTSCTVRQVQQFPRTISVSGTGVVSLKADQVTITMSVQTSNPDLQVANSENAQKIAAVTTALASTGISDTDITTRNFNIYQTSHWDKGVQIKGDYNVSNQIVVIVRNPENAGNVIDAAVKAGANEFSSLQYGVSETAPAVKQARILAMKKAEEAAQLLAGTSGAVIGKVVTISEEYVPFNDAVEIEGAMLTADNAVGATMLKAAAPTKINSGKSEVSVTVHVTYALK